MSLASSIASCLGADAVHARDRPEELLAVGVVVGRDPGQHSAREEVAIPVAAGDDLGPLGDRPVELILQGRCGRVRRERPHRGVLGGRIAGLRRGHLLAELLEEVVVESVRDDEPLSGVAGLPGVVESPGDRGLDRLVHVVGAEQDERVRPAELEHDLLQVAPGDLGDGSAGALGAGQRDAPDPRILDRLLDLVVRGEDRLVGAVGEAGVGHHRLDRLCRLGALMRRLQQDRVADHEIRAGEACHLVVGEVPRHDPDQRADRRLADQGRPVSGKQLDWLVREQFLRAVGVEAVDVGAEVDLAERLLHRLAHLANDDLGQRLAPLRLEVRHLLDQRRTLGHRGLEAPVLVGVVSRRDRGLELLVGHVRVLLDRLAGRRVDDCVLAHLASLLLTSRDDLADYRVLYARLLEQRTPGCPRVAGPCDLARVCCESVALNTSVGRTPDARKVAVGSIRLVVPETRGGKVRVKPLVGVVSVAFAVRHRRVRRRRRRGKRRDDDGELNTDHH